MAVLKPRNRIVYFRVSEEEFKRFTDLCKLRGARSLSDLFRSAVHHFADDRPATAGTVSVMKKLEQLDQQLAALKERLDEISADLPEPAADGGIQLGGGEGR